MFDSLVDLYWQVFGLGDGNVTLATKIAASYSWLMLVATFVALIRFIKNAFSGSLVLIYAIVSLSYFSTDFVVAAFYQFYSYFDDINDYKAISLSYTILDSLTAVLVMLVLRRATLADEFIRAVDIMLIVLLVNGASHFLITGYYVIFDSNFSVLVAMLYSSIILVNDTLLVAVMFMPSIANGIQSVLNKLKTQLFKVSDIKKLYVKKRASKSIAGK